MERRAWPPSSASRRCKSSWRAALLAVFILNSCFLLTGSQGVNWTTKIPVKWEPLHPFKGQSLTLTPGGSLNFLSCNWYRGDQVDEGKRIFMYLSFPEQRNGLANTGRESGGPNCSLHIKRLMPEDSGNYTVLKKINGAPSEIGHARVDVLGARSMDGCTIAWIVVVSVLVGVLIGFILHWMFCDCYSDCCWCPGVQSSRRYPPHAPYFAQESETF